MATAQNQFSAILNKAKSNTLTSQLFGGKAPVSPFTSTTPAPSPFVSQYQAPKSTQPQTTAAAANVKSSQAPKATTTPSVAPNPSAGQNETVAAGAGTPGYSYQNGVLQSVGGQSVGAQPHKTPEAETPVKKVTTNHSDGSSSTTEYHAPEKKQPTYPGIIGSLVSNSEAGSPMAGTAGKRLLKGPDQNAIISQRAEDTRDLYGGKIAEIGQLGAGAVAGDLSTGTNVVGSGNAAIASQSASQRMSALAADEQAQLDALDRELTAQNQGQSALTSAGGLGNTAQAQLQSGLTSAGTLASPQLGQSGQQYYSPLSTTSGGVQLPAEAQTFVSDLARQVSNGQMTRAEAESRLSAYGVAGLQALNGALGQGFDSVGSNAQAAARTAATTATGTVGGQLTKAADSASQALDKLESDFNQLNALQTGGIPVTNNIVQWISSAIGGDGVSAYDTTLRDARAQLSGVLTASGAVTPTSADEMARGYLPDGMTAGQLKEKIAAARALIQQKVQAFTTVPSTSSSQNSNASSNPPGWF